MVQSQDYFIKIATGQVTLNFIEVMWEASFFSAHLTSFSFREEKLCRKLNYSSSFVTTVEAKFIFN